MKRIINGKRYDTDTAKEWASWSNIESVSDFNYYCETLYQKKTGEFFLHGEGGPMTKYAEPCDTNSWTGGARIMPISVTEAKTWAEHHLTGDEYEEIFGIVDEDETGKSRQLTISMDSALADKAESLARSSGMSLNKWFESLVKKV